MLIEFKCESDSSLWMVDTGKLRFARVSAPMEEIIEGESVVEEFGELVPQSPVLHIYKMNGRDQKTEAPGQGLCTVAILIDIFGQDVVIGIKGNVAIKESRLITKILDVKCEVMEGT